jgi:hypothetical protein
MRTFLLCGLHQVLSWETIKDEMGSACSTHQITKKWTQNLLERPRRRWEDTVETDLKQGVDRIQMVRDRIEYRALLDTAMNLRDPYNARKLTYWTTNFSRMTLLWGLVGQSHGTICKSWYSLYIIMMIWVHTVMQDVQKYPLDFRLCFLNYYTY